MNRRKFLKCALMLAALLPLAEAVAVPPPAVTRGKVVVIYFSWSKDGNTRFAAETIAHKADAKIYEIKPKKSYSTDYRACCDEAKPECYGKQLRPIRQIEGLDLSQFEVVFIGTPNWYGTMAPPVRTFLTENSAMLRGKNLCLFQTNDGSGMQRCAQEFIEILPGHNILPAKAFIGNLVRNSVTELEKFVTDRVKVGPDRPGPSPAPRPRGHKRL